MIRLVRYRHYKGKEYEVIGVAFDTKTDSKVVLYKPLYPCPDLEGEYGLYPFFTRPYDEFFGDVVVDGKTVKRFTALP